ncbi:MAG: 2-C-methyl-D-erythritol 2,4-cyclodiphosphate synthase, partial [Elusimicrobia bacterium]|nr:2-C-methyl-D-erythritol 2,4-cyclodiphosphate synthase [Elusimicrobiota bacterium]
MRSGIGYDIHRLGRNRPLILGGVKIPHKKGLIGHSDADVLIHAIIDAILGAAALGDIGQHFPDSDPEFKGVSSLYLLEQVNLLLRKAGYEVNNIDSTIVCEEPKLSGYIEEMRENISKILDIPISDVSVKATTNEGLGEEGKKNAISSTAIST